jgi:hypothetical protein
MAEKKPAPKKASTESTVPKVSAVSDSSASVKAAPVVAPVPATTKEKAPAPAKAVKETVAAVPETKAPPKAPKPKAAAATASEETKKPNNRSKATSGQYQMPDQETIDKMVAEAAYYLAEKRNFATGFEAEDWQEAKEQIMAQLLGTKNPKKGKV